MRHRLIRVDEVINGGSGQMFGSHDAACAVVGCCFYAEMCCSGDRVCPRIVNDGEQLPLAPPTSPLPSEPRCQQLMTVLVIDELGRHC